MSTIELNQVYEGRNAYTHDYNYFICYYDEERGYYAEDYCSVLGQCRNLAYGGFRTLDELLTHVEWTSDEIRKVM